MNEKISAAALRFVLGFAGGMFVGIGIFSMSSPYTKEARIFQQENQPSVMRLYSKVKVIRDDILIQDPQVKEKYSPIKEYLEKITNEYDRKIEESRIKKLVDW